MSGRVRSSQQTRADILSVARRQFADHGFARTTTRSVVGEVGVDPALVTRYFGSKAALFDEAVAHELALPDLRGQSRAELGATVVNAVLDAWQHQPALLALLRTAPTSPEAADLLTRTMVHCGLTFFGSIVPDHLEERAILVSAQILGFAFIRRILAEPTLTAMARDEAVAWLGPVVAALLLDPYAGAPESAPAS